MGVINRQASKRTYMAFLGAGIGVISQLWVYSLAFDIYGEVQFILSMIAFFLPFASFGFINLTNRFFPYFSVGDKKENGFVSIILFLSVFSFLLFAGFFFLFREQYYTLIEYMNFDLKAFDSYNSIIFASLFFAIISNVFTLHASNYKRIVVPYIFNVLSWKVLMPILILAYVYNLIADMQIYTMVVVIYVFISIAQLIYLIYIGARDFKPQISKPLKENYKSMFYFASYGLLANMGTLMAFKIDKIMIRGLTDSFSTGVYSSFIVLAGLILIPYSSIISIAAPFIAKASKESDNDAINKLNNQSSNVLLVMGMVIFLGMCLCIDDLLQLTSNYEDYKLGLNAFFFLGVAKTIDSTFGINSLILKFSQFYYIGFIAMAVMAIANISLNMSLIPIYGMTGAAIATSISILVYNLVIQLFNYFKFGYQPFDKKTIGIILLVLGVYFPLFFVNGGLHPLIMILMKGSIFITLIWGGLVYFDLSPEVTNRGNTILLSIKKRLIN